VLYYRLNGYFVGEFGARALAAGRQDVPTIYLAGDDKAARAAEATVPAIETTAVKCGRGLERADHVEQEATCAAIRDDAVRAAERRGEIPRFDVLEPPYTLDIRHFGPFEGDLGDR